MVQRKRWILALAASVAAVMAIPAQAGPPNLTGTWSCCGSGGAGAQKWVISSGTGSIEGVAESPSGSVFATISGDLSGNQVRIVTAYNEFDPGYVATFKGTLAANGSSLSGTWESNQGQSGTWTADRLDGPPQYGQAVDAEVVSGKVLIKPKGAAKSHLLTGEEQIPTGSIVDTTRGRVRLISATGPSNARPETAEFYNGTFTVLQPAHGPPTTELDLEGIQPSACRGGQNAGRRFARSHGKQNSLWGNGHGDYVTKGHAGSATVRGTIWLTEERCDGTFFEAKRDTVVVHDFIRHRTITLHTGQHYLAPAR